ncbi:MAG: secreted Zn-dependent insulinase-like peptidase [Glaciecola sp.]
MQTHVFNTLLTNCRTLKSGLQLAFIEPGKIHTNAQQASISVALNQGNFHALDFPDGFAHLYEHMIFNASNTYKNGDALDKHLFAHHGQVNGWTRDSSTHFHMNCDSDGFERACDIFLDRLCAPLFSYEDIEKEIIAINAEFEAKKEGSVRQLLSVQKASCNKAHPFSVFSNGNQTTLGVLSTSQTHALLQKYHKNVMQGKYLSICIGINTDEYDNTLKFALAQKIEAAFATTNKQKFKNQLSNKNWGPVYLPQHLNKFIQVAQDNAHHQLIITYILPKRQCENFAKHTNTLYIMLCHLLESKHEHGLFHLLKIGRLVIDIHSYYKALDAHSDELVVSIQLSHDGAQKPQTVYHYLQSYIDFLQHEKIEPWRFREKASQYSLSLNVNKGSGLLQDCIELSQLMSQHQAYAIKTDPHNKRGDVFNTITAKKFQAAKQKSQDSNTSHEQLEPWQLMPDMISQLKQQNTRVYFISPLAHTDRNSAHYNTPYGVEALVTKNLAPLITPYFIKPRQNPYMASQYPLVNAQIDPTKLLLLKSIQGNFKFYQDLRFNLPNGECYISITEPEMYGSSIQLAAKRVWLSCLNEYLAATFFDVELASIHYRVYAHNHGISIHTGGLSERQLLLCIELVNAIRQFKASIQNIEQHLYKTLSLIKNKPKQRPVNQLFAQLNEYYQHDEKKQHALLISLEALTPQAIFIQQTHYFRYNFIETLLIGNWKTESAKRFYKQLNTRFQALRSVIKPKLTSPPIVSGQHIHLTLPPKHGNSLVWHYIPLLNDREKARIAQSKPLKLKLSARALVLEKLLSHTIFDVLRQQHKMGYELGIGYKPIGRYPGIAMYAVSQTHSTDDIYQGMQQAIANAKRMIVNQQVIIKEVVNALTKQVTPRETDISQTASRTWLHFEDQNPILAYLELVDALAALSKDEIIQTLDNLANTKIGQVTMAASAHEGVIGGAFNATITQSFAG